MPLPSPSHRRVARPRPGPTRRAGAAWLRLSVAALVALAPLVAQAQDPVVEDRPSTAGLERPIHDYSGAGDASSLELNPALLAAVRGLDFVVRGFTPTDRGMRGGGVGGWLSTNLGFGVATALGVQRITPRIRGGDFDPLASSHPSGTKVSLGLALGDGKKASFGVAVHGVVADRGQGSAALAGADVDLGALFRFGRWAALGAVATFAPATQRGRLDREEVRVTGELAIRPLGTEVLELAGGVRARFRATDDTTPLDAASGADLSPRARLGVRWKGIGLAGELDAVDLAVLDDSTRVPIGRRRVLRAGVMLDVAWDFARAGVGVLAGSNGGVDGVGIMARTSSRRQGRVFPARLVDAERIDLSALRTQRELIALLERIERAREAGGRSVLVVDTRDIRAGFASLEEIRAALVRARDAGAHVFAYMEGGGLKALWMASVAEITYVHPAADLAPYGIAQRSFYLRDALAKIGIRVEALHVREYKSAHEIFTRTDRSPADREQRDALLDTTWDVIIGDVARGRRRTKAEVRSFVDDAPHAPAAAEERGFADEVVYRDQLLKRIGDEIGVDVKWAEFPDTEAADQVWSDQPYFAVVLIEGTIVDGDSLTLPFIGTINTGGDTIAKLLRSLRKDKACRGIVLRVDSPGGSALASDVIWREVELTREAHERDARSPAIVVSMSDVAASGGYYVAAAATRVFALETTVTGSIGVVSLHFDLSGLLRWAGVKVDVQSRGRLADVDSPFEPWTDEERERLFASMQNTYELFKKRVAEGRGLDLARVDELGRGRVWSGRDAKARGLVDEIGGLQEAVTWLERETSAKPWLETSIRVLPRKPRLLDLILDDLGPDLGGLAMKAAERRKRSQRGAVPRVLDAALSRLPLSLLLLHDGRPAVIADPHLEID